MAGWVVIELVLFDGVGFYRVSALWRGGLLLELVLFDAMGLG